MDQVKQILRQLKKHRFWVLSGVVTIIGAVIYFIATGNLDKQKATASTKIDQQYGGVTAARSVQDHPNDFSHKKMDEVETAARDLVAKAWRRQYERQLDVLVWPKELKEDFEASVINLRPVEAIPFPTPLSREISVELRARYRDYVQGVLPKLATIINSNWSAVAGGGAGSGPGGAMGGSGLRGFGGGAPNAAMMPGGGGAAGMTGGAGGGSEDDQYVVQWNPSNQSAIMERYDWSKQAENVPKTLQILYSQEDYWILTSIMQIIARTNDGADANYKAAVKRIDGIDLGAFAQRSGQVTRLGGGSTSAGMAGGAMGSGGPLGGGSAPGPSDAGAPGMQAPPGGMSGGPGGMQGGSGGVPPGMMPGMGGGSNGMGGAGASDADPLESRYVDVDLNPVKAATAREALNVKTPTDAILAVAKRMPVRLQLQVDIRRLNRLLAECGNADLPLEIRQVRINPQAMGGGGMGGGGMGGGGMGGGGMGGGGMGGSGMGGSGMGGSGMGGSGMGGVPPGARMPGMPGSGGNSLGPGMAGGMGRGRIGTTHSVETPTFDINVELFGLVYIFNPPNESKLGVGQTAGAVASPPGATSAVGVVGAPRG